jgi:hypothetical protein
MRTVVLLRVLTMAGALATQIPLATPADKAHAPLEISRDGKTVTFRDAAPDDLEVCVEPARDRFGRRVCFTVGDVRHGRVRAR